MGIYQGNTPLSIPGKSAYQYAVDGGYEGTEVEFCAFLASAESTVEGKQNALSGTLGQMVGFDKNGNAVAQDVPASKPSITVVTLAAAGWNSSSLTQSVTVIGILADETKQLIQCAPVGANMSTAAEAGVYCSAQGAGTLTFTCTSIPTVDISFSVSFQDATYI